MFLKISISTVSNLSAVHHAKRHEECTSFFDIYMVVSCEIVPQDETVKLRHMLVC